MEKGKMRKFIFILGLCFGAVLQVTFAQAKPVRNTLQATVDAQRTTISELESRNIELSFAVVNTGKETTESHLADSRLFINSAEIKDWNRYKVSSQMLEAGQTQSLSVRLFSHFKNPGAYEVVWKSEAFQSPALKINVLRDRVMPEGKEPKHFALVRAIRAQLPPGWEAFGELWPIGQLIRIVRLQPTRIAQPMSPSMGFGDDDAAKPNPFQRFELTLYTEPFIAPTDYPQLKIDNDAVYQKLHQLGEQMQDIPTMKGQYSPETPEHKKQFEEYERVRETLRHVPEFYFRDVSLNFDSWNWHNNKHNYLLVHDKAIRAECKEVTQRVINLLSSYEPQEVLPDGDD